MKNGIATVSLDDLINAALTHKPYNQKRLGRQAHLYARRLSMAYAKDFPEDLHDEVFDQAFVELLQIPADALKQRSGKALFRRSVLAAIRSVRSSYAPPGQQTRPTHKPRQSCVAAEAIGQVVDAAMLDRCTVGEDNNRTLNFDMLESPSATNAQLHTDHCLQAESILRHAPQVVRTALRLIYLDDEPVEAVAARLSLTRFSLNRRIDAFCNQWRIAA